MNVVIEINQNKYIGKFHIIKENKKENFENKTLRNCANDMRKEKFITAEKTPSMMEKINN